MPESIHSDPEKSIEYLRKELSNRKFTPKFARNGGDDDDSARLQQRDDMIQYIRKCIRDIFYFPDGREKMIWSDEVAANLLATSPDKSIADLDEKGTKNSYFELAKLSTDLEQPSGEQIDFVHGLFIRNWVSKQAAGFEDCVEIVTQIRSLLNSAAVSL